MIIMTVAENLPSGTPCANVHGPFRDIAQAVSIMEDMLDTAKRQIDGADYKIDKKYLTINKCSAELFVPDNRGNKFDGLFVKCIKRFDICEIGKHY